MTEVGSQFLKGKIVIKLRFTFFVFVTLFIALAKENKLGNFLFPAEVGESGAKLIEIHRPKMEFVEIHFSKSMFK